MSIIYLPIQSAYGQNIKPFDGALLYVYEVGTTTLKAVYSDKAETVALDNPVEADSRGRWSAMYISGLYKLVCKDKNGVTIWTEDNLQGRSGDIVWGGNFDSTTNSSNYPASGNQGDWYVVTTGFTLATVSGGYTLNTRDFIIANKDGATGIDADWDIVRGKNSLSKSADFSSKNLLIDVAGNTTVDVNADALTVIDSNGQTKLIQDLDDTYDITTDLMTGTTEKSSHRYWLWIDSDETLLMVPDLTGTADADVLNSLSASAMTFVTDLVKPWDEIYQTTDLTKGYVGEVTEEGVLTCVDADGAALDLFPDGDETFIIRLLSPTGLGAYRARIGAAYNNSSGNLDDSFYTQIQEEKTYIGAVSGANFDVSSNPAVTTIERAIAFIRQSNDWTGIGIWKINFNIAYNMAVAARTEATMTISGVTFKNSGNFFQAAQCFTNSAVAYFSEVYASPNSSTVVCIHANATTSLYAFSGDCEVDKKPTFHT